MLLIPEVISLSCIKTIKRLRDWIWRDNCSFTRTAKRSVVSFSLLLHAGDIKATGSPTSFSLYPPNVSEPKSPSINNKRIRLIICIHIRQRSKLALNTSTIIRTNKRQSESSQFFSLSNPTVINIFGTTKTAGCKICFPPPTCAKKTFHTSVRNRYYHNGNYHKYHFHL